MSEPMKNVEIEDVLASIKRLVSASPSSDPQPEPSQPTETTPTEKPPGKLMLTPALRVTDAADLVETPYPKSPARDPWVTENTVVFEEPEDEKTFIGAAQFTSRDSLEATIAELEAAVVSQPDEWEPDGSEVKTVPTWETVSYPTLDDVEDAVAVEESSPSEMRGEPEPEADILNDPIFTNGHFIPEEAETSFRDNVESLDASFLTFSHIRPIPEAEPEPTVAPIPEPVAEIAIPVPVQPEDPDEDYGDELAPDDDDDLGALFLGAGQGIDENLLRLLVADVVREELQGKMGEKITRNVRRMVRREIHRTLDIHKLD